jgi:hypothetical protein
MVGLAQNRLLLCLRSPINIGTTAAFALAFAFAMRAVGAPAFQDQPLSDKTGKVSDHVWAIIGFPNVGIIVGDNATLVVDTGLGRRNGATPPGARRRSAGFPTRNFVNSRPSLTGRDGQPRRGYDQDVREP